MARKYLVPIDLAQQELQNARVQNLGTAPGSPVAGQLYYDTALLRLRWYNGTTWVDAQGGSPTGAAGGVLSGTYPNPGFATDPYARANHTGTESADTQVDGTTNHVFTAADDTKLTGIATGATANSSDATLLARANHTGTQTASTVSDFNTAVRTNRPDQLATNGADLAMGGFKLTGLGTPTADTDAATKGYADALAFGIAWKDQVRVNTLTNITLTAPGATLDGVTMVAGDRWLASGQTLPAANGIYVWNGAAVAATRALDADSVADLAGAAVFVTEGTSADSGWNLITEVVTVGTTAQTWSQFTGLGQVTAGTGLTKTGNTIDAVAGTGIIANANDLAVDTAVVVRKYAVDCAAATSTVATHNLATRDVQVAVYRSTTPWDEVECDVERTTTNTVTVRFGVAPAAADYRIVVQG